MFWRPNKADLYRSVRFDHRCMKAPSFISGQKAKVTDLASLHCKRCKDLDLNVHLQAVLADLSFLNASCRGQRPLGCRGADRPKKTHSLVDTASSGSVLMVPHESSHII